VGQELRKNEEGLLRAAFRRQMMPLHTAWLEAGFRDVPYKDGEKPTLEFAPPNYNTATNLETYKKAFFAV
jgi:hypothetical protein